MGKLALSNVIQVSVLSSLKGLLNPNTSALALITKDVPLSSSYGTYGIYKDPVAVAADFGSNSETFALATAVFSQNPNILSGNGFLVIIPRLAAAAATAATILGTGLVDLTTLTASDYKIKLAIDGGSAAELAIGTVDSSSVAAAAASLNSTAVAAAGVTFQVSGSINSASILLKSNTTGASSEIVVSATASGTNIAPLLNIPNQTVMGTASGLESLKDCILRVYTAVPFFGLIIDETPADAVITQVAGIIQSIGKIWFVGASDSAKVAGIFTTILNDGYTNTRCLFYSKSNYLSWVAGYASRGLSMNLDQPNTVITMHLKDLIGFDADDLTQTFLNSCQAAGVDVYADFGIPKVFTSGANDFFDQVFIRLALGLRLQIAGFNYLAQTGTKIAQTEEGMNGLKSAYRTVMVAFVSNGAFAPGAWNEATFGNPGDMVRNISDFGFYIFSPPVSSQSQNQRNQRVAPVVQIAGKSSGAIHSSDVVAFIEA